MSAPPVPLELRPMGDGDRNFVLASWLRSYAGKGEESYDDARAFYADYAPVVLALMARSTVVVACLPEEPSAIVGWYAVEGETLHYVLVKPRWRRLGVARWLLEDFAGLTLAYTHRTSDARRCPIPSAWEFRRWHVWKETGHEAQEHRVPRPSERLGLTTA